MDRSPLGPAPITERPQGLLELLGLKNGGQYPQHMSELLAPTFDLGSWYRQWQKEVRAPADVTFTNLGTSFLLDTVPAGEVWFVHEVNVRSTAAVSNLVTQLGIEVWTSDSTGFVECLLNGYIQPYPGTATTRVSCVARFTGDPVLLRPGTPIYMGPTVLAGSTFPVMTPRLIVTRCGM